jgi:hypothetical protein
MSLVDSKLYVDHACRTIVELRKTSPSVLFMIKRAKNENIVVYEYAEDRSNVDVYWLELDAKFVTAARKKNVYDDKTQLIMIEKPAYGCQTLIERNSSNEDVVTLVIAPLPERKIQVLRAAGGLDAPRWIAQTTIRGTVVNLQFVYVETKSVLGMIPKVQWIEIYGIDANNNLLRERIKPK